MTNHEFWYISRAAGFTAYLLIFASVALGLLQNTRLAERFIRRNAMFDMHRFVSLMALGFSLLHMYILLGDEYIGFNVRQLTVPFLSPYRGWQVAMGSLGFYAMVIVIGSFYVRGMLGYRTWRTLHFATFGMFALVTLHGLTAGSDTGEAWANAIYFVTGGVTVALLAYRLQRRLPAGGPVRQLRFAAGGATVVLVAAMLAYVSVQGEPERTFATATRVAPEAPSPSPYVRRFSNDVAGTITLTREDASTRLRLVGQGIGEQPMQLIIEVEQVATSSVADRYEDDDEHEGYDDHDDDDEHGDDDDDDERGDDDDAYDDDDDEHEYEERGGGARVVRNDVRIFTPDSAAAVCVGTVTAMDSGAMSLTCDGIGAWAGSRMDIATRFRATDDGAFTGAMTGTVTRFS